MYTDAQIKEILSQKLKKERYIHTLGVCQTAVEMAKRFDVDEKKTYLAALLHDCAKYMSFQEQIEYADRLNLLLGKDELLCPAVIHAPLGAAIAREEYGIIDEEILRAISAHTVANENMSDMDKIIYSADMIEPNRIYDGVEKLRQLSKSNLDATFTECLKMSISFNLNRGNPIHPASLKCWNNIVKKGN